MDNEKMIQRLQEAGMTFEPGLSHEEINHIESFFGFHFPTEIKSFYTCAFPSKGPFFNWRDLSANNLERLQSFYNKMENSFLFDIEHNSLQIMFAELGWRDMDKVQFTDAVLRYLHESPKLIPFYAHRCFFDGMDDMPIISFWQPTDSIFYGKNFEDYLEVEFLNKPLYVDDVPDRMKDTGIWYYLIG